MITPVLWSGAVCIENICQSLHRKTADLALPSIVQVPLYSACPLWLKPAMMYGD